MAGNEATIINASDVSISLTSHGSDWLWSVFSVFTLSTLIHAFVVASNHRKDDRFKVLAHAAPLAISAILSYTYFTTASNLGWTGIKTEFNTINIGDGIRQVFYARYIGWFLVWPSLLFLFEYNAQAQHVLTDLNVVYLLANLIIQIVTWEIFVVALLIGSLVTSSYKWGYWTFGASALIFGLIIFVSRQLFGSNAAKSIPNVISVGLLTVSTLLYTVSWGLSEGGNVIQPDSEAVFYGILDLVNFLVIPLVLIFDALKHGTFVSSAGAPTPASTGDLEKASEAPDLRASGETQIGLEDQDIDQLQTQHA